MQMTEGEIESWVVTHAVLAAVEPFESTILPEIAESLRSESSLISKVPGAFDFDSVSIQTVAAAIMPVVAAGLAWVLPKLFDATIDIAKDSLKKVLEKRIAEQTPISTLTNSAGVQIDPKTIREVIDRASRDRRLAQSTADAIADALIAHLCIK